MLEKEKIPSVIFKPNNLGLAPLSVNKKMENRSQLNSGKSQRQTSVPGVVLQSLLKSGEVQTFIPLCSHF